MSDPLAILIATRIKRARKARHLYAKQVAELAGVSENTYLYVERTGRTRVSTLANICRALQISITLPEST